LATAAERFNLLKPRRFGRGLMMKTAFALAFVLLAWPAAAAEAQPGPSIYEAPPPPAPDNPIDQQVRERLSTLGIPPTLCSDAVFIRRVSLDLLGKLPTAAEARAFITDPDTANKRRRLIDRWLQREEFADYWAMKWGDLLRIKAEFPVNLWPNAAQAYHRWVRAALARNQPYDQFARELLTASGSNFRVGPVNFYRALPNRTPEGIAAGAALIFMGTRTDAWPESQLAGLAACFSQVGYKPTREWKEEIVFWDPLKDIPEATNGLAVLPPPPRSNAPPRTAVFPDGTRAPLSAERDPREVFADWLTAPGNPWFARNIANRVWAWLLGRGLIHEPDDLRPDNPPSNPALLAYLEKELVASHYDLKHLFRIILNSQTYQSSSLPRGDVALAEANQGCYVLRRLEAEVLIDAINQITGTSDLYTSAIPEPFTYIPSDQPAVALADGSITSPFLALFGRSARATGMENERINKMLPPQWLHLLNSSHIQRKLEQGPGLRALGAPPRQPRVIATNLYLAILSRFPSPDELKVLENYIRSARLKSEPRREHLVDIAWALINSPEFIYRH